MWHARARPLAQIAEDFGLLVTTLKRGIAVAERRETGAGPAAAEFIVWHVSVVPQGDYKPTDGVRVRASSQLCITR